MTNKNKATLYLPMSRRSTAFPHGVIQWLHSRRVVPAAFARNDPVSLSRAPGIRLILMDWRRLFQDRVDNLPGGLDAVLSGKESSVAPYGIAEKPLIGRHLIAEVLAGDQVPPLCLP